MAKFFGTREELDKWIRAAGFNGEWHELPGDKVQFVTPDGAVLNWWSTTKTIPISRSGTSKEPV